MNDTTREKLIQQHLDAIRLLQAQPAAMNGHAGWPPRGYYLLWHTLVGAMLGLLGGAVSLVANVIGAPLFDKHPLELIRVYLTFPMGGAALNANDGKVLTVGCILYLLTGAVYGVLFHLILSSVLSTRSPGTRFIAASAIGLSIWVANFYGILSWLQPVLLGGNWIIRLVPFWVAAVTHLIFAWTMLLVQRWAVFVPYQQSASSLLSGTPQSDTLDDNQQHYLQ